MVPLQYLFQDFFRQEKYIWARKNVPLSAEHLLSAQQYTQQHAHQLMAAALPQQSHFGARAKRSLDPTVKPPCVPLWIVMLENLAGVVISMQEVKAVTYSQEQYSDQQQDMTTDHVAPTGFCHTSAT